MRTKESLIVNPTYLDLTDDIRVVWDEDGTQYWSANDLNKFVPSKQLGEFVDKRNIGIWDFIRSVEKFIIPGKDGIITKRGKGGGTYLQRLIAMRFAAWLSPEFEVQVYLAYDQSRKLKDDWSSERALTIYEQHILTDSIQANLTKGVDPSALGGIYAREFAMLNEIVFGQKYFDHNPRETATPAQLYAITRLQRQNAVLIDLGVEFGERGRLLNDFYNERLYTEMVAKLGDGK